MTFDLTQASQWDALGAAWRVARADWTVTLDIRGACEVRAIEALEDVPDDAKTRARDAISARVGLPEAEQREGAACELDSDLIYAALSAPAPTLAAFLLKLEMVTDAWGFNDFDSETWPIFLADVRRFAIMAAHEAVAAGEAAQ